VGVDKATIVWTTFHEEPPFKSNATLDFTEDGKLLLRTDEGQEKLIADAIDSASHASMLDYGNFVLYGIDPKIIWQSFDYLIDTILGGQTLFAGAQLFSSLTGNNHSTGRFHLKMPLDENLVLYPINTRDTPGDAYWSSNTFVKGFKFHLYLNHTGLLVIINSTSLLRSWLLLHLQPGTKTILFIVQLLMLMEFSSCILTPMMMKVASSTYLAYHGQRWTIYMK